MKIVLIEPRASEANVYSKIPMPLLGPIYLGTILKNKGHTVEIYKEDILTPDYARLNADIYGISILTSTAKRGYEIAKKLPKEKVIMGGVHASLLPEEALEFCAQVVVGEAEGVIVDIIEGRIKDKIVYGKAIEDLDQLPHPDFSLLRGFKKNSWLVPISTSRGCPFDCSFCSVTKMFGRKYRFRSAQNVINEMNTRDTNEIFFCDDNFAANPKRTDVLLDYMLKNKIRRWSCQVRCDAANDKGLLGKMSKAGCRLVCIGFESINQQTLNSYGKKQTVKDIIDAIKSFHKHRIKIHGMFVVGSDDDSKKTVWDTMRFAVKQRIDTMQLSILTPFPGTKIYETLEKQKRIFTKDWSLYDGQHIVFSPKMLSAKEIQLNVFKAYCRFYSIWRTMAMFLKLRFRSAIFNIMGCVILKQWKKHNRGMEWLLEQYRLN